MPLLAGMSRISQVVQANFQPLEPSHFSFANLAISRNSGSDMQAPLYAYMALYSERELLLTSARSRKRKKIMAAFTNVPCLRDL
jgi:hypothetical protein